MFPREHDVEKSNADFDKLKTLDEQLQFFKDKYKKRISEEKMNQDLEYDFYVQRDLSSVIPSQCGFGADLTIESSPNTQCTEVKVSLMADDIDLELQKKTESISIIDDRIL